MTRETVVVTGGAGYIGSHACKVLSEAGYQPVVIDNLAEGHRWAVKWGPLIEADLTNRDAVEAALRTHQPVGVMHFAAYAYVGESVTDPSKYYNNNVGGTLALLDAMRATGVHRLIFSSTCATYGVPQAVPISVDHPQAPINPYGASKWMIERVLADYGAAYGMQYAPLRYFNAAGDDPDGEIGEAHDPETHLIPLAIEAALGLRQLKVFGTDYPTPDGTAVRDYIHVMDLAKAHVLALRYLMNGGESRPFNLGTGTGYSVRQVLDMVEQVSGRPVAAEDAPRREGDPPALVADASESAETLGWEPSMSSLESIVSSAWRWHTAWAERGGPPPALP